MGLKQWPMEPDAVDEKDAVGYRLQQGRILLFAESQRLDGARAAHHVADADASAASN